MHKRLLLGYLELTFAQLMIGSNIVIAKALIEQFPMMLLLSLRFIIGALILGLYAGLTRMALHKRRDGHPLSRKDWLVLLSQALCAGLLFNLFMLGGLNFTTASVAGIITSTTPAAIIVFSFIFLRERVTGPQLIAISLAIAGLVVLGLGDTEPGGDSTLLGGVLVMLAVIPEALFTVMAKWYGSQVKPLVMASIVGLFNGMLFLPFLIWYGVTYPIANVTLLQWLLLIYYGLSGGVLFYLFWYRGLAHIPANEAALFTSVTPLSSVLLAATFLGEAITLPNFIGMSLVIFSIMIGSKGVWAWLKSRFNSASDTA